MFAENYIQRCVNINGNVKAIATGNVGVGDEDDDELYTGKTRSYLYK
jgi:hypothetical protein